MNHQSLTLADKMNLYAILACCLIGYRYDLEIFYNFAIGFSIGGVVSYAMFIRLDYLILKKKV